MKTLKLLLAIFLFCISISTKAQQSKLIPDLSEVNDSLIWTVYNRNVTYDDAVHLDRKEGDGLLRLQNFDFQNGTIELDIKGKNELGSSFVGLAFRGLNDSTYDAVYFRPFNFENPERRNHSVQYISQPVYPWYRLREESPGKYENSINPPPQPEEWFHATIVIEYPVVKVFVNNSEEASLIINQLSLRNKGWLGFWVGNNSEGYFKNLRIISY